MFDDVFVNINYISLVPALNQFLLNLPFLLPDICTVNTQTSFPSSMPTIASSLRPTVKSTRIPIATPTVAPSAIPTIYLSSRPTFIPNSLKVGLMWTAYFPYFNDDVSFGTSAAYQKYFPQNAANGANTGFATDFSSLTLATEENFPSEDENRDNFNVEWIGYFYTQDYEGSWTFSTTSDDASYLWIGSTATTGYTKSNALVNNGGPHGMDIKSGSITLLADTYYPIRIQFGEEGGSNNMIVTFVTPDGTSITDGADYYFFSLSYVSGLIWNVYHNFFNNDVNFATSGNYQKYLDRNGYSAPTTDFSSLTRAIGEKFPFEYGYLYHFSIEWLGYFYTQNYGGSWTFSTNSDDGSFLFIDDKVIVNNSGDHGMRIRSGSITLLANSYYPIRIQFGQLGGYYDMIVTFVRPDGVSLTNGGGYYFHV